MMFFVIIRLFDLCGCKGTIKFADVQIFCLKVDSLWLKGWEFGCLRKML